MGWEWLAIIVISALVSIALAPKAPTPPPPELGDVNAPIAQEGTAIPVVFGTVWITGPTVIWYGDLRTTPIRKKAGKK